jgi:poly(3-hydroxybutyrate) depolymerase
MTRLTMQKYSVDAERVYIWGGSSGGSASSNMAVTYPDLYAAYGVIVAGGYAQHAVLACSATPHETDGRYAARAVAEMERHGHKRVMPLITFGGTGGADPFGEDPTGAGPDVGAGCTSHAWRVGMDINNLLTGGRYDEAANLQYTAIGTVTGGRFSADPSSTEKGQVPGGFAWTKEVERDTARCLIGERWKIHGMGHAYPGGYAEPKAPDAGRAAWNFFSRYRLSDTGNECAESQS